MGLFDRNLNTFYNSTWHLYRLPSLSWYLTNPIVTQDDNNKLKLNWEGYDHPLNSIVWNPFGIELKSLTGYNPNTGEYGVLPTSPRYVEPSQHSYLNPISPYKSFAQLQYGYDDIYSDIDSNKKGVDFWQGDTLTNGIAGGLNAASTGLRAWTKGTETKVGKYAAPFTEKLSKLPGVAGLMGSFLNFGIAAQNAAVGSKLNDTNIKLMEAAINNRARQLFGDNATTDALIAGSINNVDLANPKAEFYGDEGFLNKLRGVGKTYNKKWEFDKLITNANLQARNAEELAYKGYLNKMIRRYLLLPFAMGGFIGNKYAEGGDVNSPYTHGSLFSNGLVLINNGGSHEANPYQGVLYGIDPYGVPNLVEEGETIFNAGAYGGPDDYSFSDRIKFPMKQYGEMFSLGGRVKRKKGKRAKSYTFADISKMLAKESEERSNDPISMRTLADNLGKLATAQEEVKAKDMLDLMNPLDIMAALQQSPMGEQMMGGMLQGIDEQAMMEQQGQPMMAACGGKLHGYGGNIFADGSFINQMPFINQYNIPFDINDYVLSIQDPRVYRGRSTGNGGVTNHSYVDGKVVTDLPQSMILNEPLFERAVTEYIDDKKQQYDAAVQQGRFEDAYNIAYRLQSDIFNINKIYFGTYNYDRKKYTRPGSVELLLKWFDELGLNKYVNEILNTPKDNGEYLIYKGTKDKKTPYTSDNSLDFENGSVTQARFFPISETNKRKLELMEMTIDSYENLAEDVFKRYGDNITDKEHRQIHTYTIPELKNIPLALMKDIFTSNVIKNSKYKKGSDKDEEKDEFIPIDKDILLYVPKNYSGTAELWWASLTPQQQQNEISKYYKTYGDLTRTGVYENTLVYEPLDRPYTSSAQSTLSKEEEERKKKEAEERAKRELEYLKLVPKKDWESLAALGVVLGDYLNSIFGEGKTFNSPGINPAYSYLGRLGNVPVVRSTPTGTMMTYNPVDSNFNLNNIRSDIFGTMRTSNNMNRGNAVANDIAILNSGYDLIGKQRLQDAEENLKKLQFVLTNNNLVQQKNADSSLAALQANAQNIAHAREAQAQIASGLAGTLAQAYNNWLNYRNQQSSGLAQMLYDQGYNKQVMNQMYGAFLLLNQQKDVANALNIPYTIVKNNNNNNSKG